jgi:DNA-binding MarR family transcriptional regulator
MASPTQYAHSLAFLLSQVGAQSASLFAQALANLGVSPRAFGVLSNLAAAEGQTQQQLADALGMHRNNMVDLVDEMETAGWIRRQRSDVDRRAFALRLTPAGRTIVERVNEQVPLIDRQLAAHLTPVERSALLEMLQRVADALGLGPGIHPHLRGTPRSAKGRGRERPRGS